MNARFLNQRRFLSVYHCRTFTRRLDLWDRGTDEGLGDEGVKRTPDKIKKQMSTRSVTEPSPTLPSFLYDSCTWKTRGGGPGVDSLLLVF